MPAAFRTVIISPDSLRGFPGLAPEIIAGVSGERLRAAAVYFTLNAANAQT